MLNTPTVSSNAQSSIGKIYGRVCIKFQRNKVKLKILRAHTLLCLIIYFSNTCFIILIFVIICFVDIF